MTHLVQVIVLSDEFLQLRLDVDDLVRGEVELDDRNTGFLEVLQEADFRRLEEHQTASLALFASSGTTDSVDVVSGVIWGVELDNPINGRNLRIT